MNYGVYGKLKTTDNVICKYAKVYAYFKKLSPISPASKWVDIPYTADISGYYSIDLGDSQFLGSESSFMKGTDKIYIAFVWNDDVSDQDINSLTFTHASFIEHTTVNVDTIEIDVTLEPKRLPILDTLTFPSANILTKHNYTIKETSHADYTWKSLAPYTTQEVSQKLMFDTVPIFDGHQMIDTIYDWKEISPRYKSNSSSDTYNYDKSGIYNVCFTIREKWNTELKTCLEVTVKYNKPIVDFTWNPKLTNNWQGPKIKGQEEITFTNLSSDLDNRVKDKIKWGSETYNFKWTIQDKLYDSADNTKVYNSKDWEFQPKHIFKSPGIKTIELEVFWNDGFQDFSEVIIKTFEVFPFDLELDFDWNVPIVTNRSQEVTFNPDLTNGDLDKIVKYNWVIEDNYPITSMDLHTFKNNETSIFMEGSPDNLVRVDNTYNLEIQYPKVKFHSIEAKNIDLTITYYNGWVNVTEVISKTLTPVKYNTEPQFIISDLTPMGRDKTVLFTNTTDYNKNIPVSLDIGYTIDWDLKDYYTSCNLDNPDFGNITRNDVIENDKPNDYILEHNFQNTDTNEIELTIRYDDGWQMQTKRVQHSVQPIVYPEPIPDFKWDITIPKNREQTVTFSNLTIDVYNRFRAYDWLINDHYNIFNPDNTEYGVSIKDNKQVILYNLDYNLEPQHNFQDSTPEEVIMTYYYDDGFCERTVQKTETITKDSHEILVNFNTDIEPINNGFFGKIEVNYFNISTNVVLDSIQRTINEKWTWNDYNYIDLTDVYTIRKEQEFNKLQPFTFQTPSRIPYSSTIWNGIEIQNLNKFVELEVRIDNGWRDDTELKNYLDPDNLTGLGSQVYFRVQKYFEASPLEVQSNITYKSNINSYTH